MKKDNTTDAFWALTKAGLWEQEVQLASFKNINYNQIYQLSEEQSVVGLIAAGLERVVDTKVPKEIVLQFVGQTLQLEQQNMAMNNFLAELTEKLRNGEIYTLLVKGQGVAQCYERPLWRASGDIDFLLSESNYDKAKRFLLPIASSVEIEGKQGLHLGMTIESWVVELHGGLRSGLSSRVDRGIEETLKEVFFGGDLRSWMNGQSQVFLPGENSDVIFIFTHFLKHFYKEGLGIRQICDWCRLLWTYKETIDRDRLKNILKRMGLVSEWKAFGAFAVEYLGMPTEAMPFYSSKAKWKRKASSICDYIIKVGNFGKNRDLSYFAKYPYLVRKLISLSRRFGVILSHTKIFPLDSIRFFPNMVLYGLRNAARGE